MTWCHEKKIWGTSNYTGCLLWDMQQGAVVPLANFQQDPLHDLNHLFFLAHMISLIRSSYAIRFPLQPMLEKCEKIRMFGTVCRPLFFHSPPTVQGWPVESRFFLKHPASAIYHFEGGTCLSTCIHLDWNKTYTACHVPTLQFANTEIYWNATTSHSNMGQNLPLTGIIGFSGGSLQQGPYSSSLSRNGFSLFLQKTT